MSEDQNRVAIVIAACNASRTISDTIRSIRTQDYRNWTLLVVDDGSTDATASVARAAFEGDERCQVLTQTNAGPGVARNAGLLASNGDLVCFVDADDCWDDGFLTTLVALLDLHRDAVGATGTFRSVDERGEAIDIGSYSQWQHEPVHRRGISLVPSPSFDYEALATRLAVPPPAGVLVRRSFVLETGGFDPRATRSEDFELWTRLAQFGDFVHSQEATFRYTIAGSQRSKRKGRGAGAVRARLLLLEKTQRRSDLWRAGLGMATFYLGLGTTRLRAAVHHTSARTALLGAANIAIAASIVGATIVALALPASHRGSRLYREFSPTPGVK